VNHKKGIRVDEEGIGSIEPSSQLPPHLRRIPAKFEMIINGGLTLRQSG